MRIRPASIMLLAATVCFCVIASGCSRKTYLKTPNEKREDVKEAEVKTEITDRREPYAVDQRVSTDRH